MTVENILVEKLTILQPSAAWLTPPKDVEINLQLCTHRQVKWISHTDKKPVYDSFYACFCIECAEIVRGPRSKNGFPGNDDSFAGFTCNWCPNELRYTESVSQPSGYENTIRCTPCNTEATAYSRSRKLAKELIEIRKELDIRARFITLSLPNYQDKDEGLKDLKKKMRNFRHTQDFQNKVAGGVDFYEYTTASDGTYNVHYHGIWLGKFWKQADLMDSWKHGGARIELVKTKYEETNAIRYCVKYLAKARESGWARTKQKFGCMFNKAR